MSGHIIHDQIHNMLSLPTVGSVQYDANESVYP